MDSIVMVAFFYGAFAAMEWPFLQSRQRGRAVYLLRLLGNLFVSLAAASELQLPTPTPWMERLIRTLPFFSEQVVA